ncbi:MAG: MBL fold metallo-hydrolase [Deferribacterota bacterium]|nr:MBL fold metallo-hydrolase [Deferribacterota bacterium]
MNSTTWQPILNGLPITSSRGFVGWSSISLIKSGNYLGLFDTGSEGARETIIKNLKAININLLDIKFIILSHLHFDHFINIELFPNAKVYTTEEELDYALSTKPKENGDLNYVKSSISFFKKQFIKVKPGVQIYNGTIVPLPGHTKGSIGFETEDCIFTGDALKYVIEAKTCKTSHAYYSQDLANKSIEKILAAHKIIIPGHDQAFKFENGNVIQLNDASLEIYKRKDSNITISIKDI